MACESQSDQCKEAREAYDNALQDLQNIRTDIEETKDVKVAGGAVAGTGVGVLLVVAALSGPPGWLIAGGVTLLVVGVGTWGVGQQSKGSKRKDCKAARKRMWDAYKSAAGSGGCTEKDCIPPRPSQSC